MAKRTRTRRRATDKQQTNWLLIGGLIAVGVVALFILLLLTLQAPAEPAAPIDVASLADYCQENPERCITKGDADAPVTVVEVSDYGCSHCRDFNLETADQLDQTYVENGQVRWVILPYALSQQTLPAAAAAMCAADQDAFFPFHNQMFVIQTTPQALTEAGFQQAAADLGMDVDAFNQCIDSRQYYDEVQANRQAATAVGVSGTPSFFVNGQMLEGAYPFASFQQIIESALNS